MALSSVEKDRFFFSGRNLCTMLVKRSIATIFAALLAFVAFPNARGQSISVVKVRTLQIDASVRPGIGQFVPADDDFQHLSYELFIANWNKEDLRFASIDVEDAASRKRLARFDSKALEDPIRIGTIPFQEKAGPANRVLRSGRTAVITIEVRLPLGASVPAAVRHRIEFESDPNIQMIRDDGSLSPELVAFSDPMPIDRARPLVIGPPLRGGPWRCGNGFSGGSWNAHDAIYAAYRIARMHVPQRFGCDFGKVDAEGNTLPNPFPNIISSSMFYGYGADVIAVADGRVVDTQDGIPENVPQADGRVITPVPLTDRTFPGNIVTLKIGEGQYAFYAHLQPGSLRVKVGDRVRKGQLLGKVGNSGNSVGPHLHFQVSNGPELNASDFVPHVYRSYWLSGYAPRGRGKPDPAKRRRIDFKVPTDGSFMTFPSK
jgi:hypothetical protein